MDRQAAYYLFTSFLRKKQIKRIDLKKDLPRLLAYEYAQRLFQNPLTVHELTGWCEFGTITAIGAAGEAGVDAAAARMRVVAAMGCSVPAADTRTAGPVTRTVAEARTAAVRGESAQVVRKVPARARRGDRIRGSDKRSASGSGGGALRTRTGLTKPRKWNWEGFFTFCKLTRTQALWDMLPLAAGVGARPRGTSPSGEPAGVHPKRDRGCAGPGEGVPFHTPGMTQLRLCRSRRRQGAVRHSSRHRPVTVARQPQQPAHGSNSDRRLRKTGQESSPRSEWRSSENFHSALSSFLGKKGNSTEKAANVIQDTLSNCSTNQFHRIFIKKVRKHQPSSPLLF